jgi:hypothetical protein
VPRGFGFVHRSRTIFCRAVPNLSITIRNLCIAVSQPLWAARPLEHRQAVLLEFNRLLKEVRWTLGHVAGLKKDAKSCEIEWGEKLTRPFRDARQLPSPGLWPGPRASRTTRSSGTCPSPRAKS